MTLSDAEVLGDVCIIGNLRLIFEKAREFFVDIESRCLPKIN